ncbi:MAG: hypothetical protein ACRCTL_02995 [Pseudomonas sp.]
MRLIRLLAWGLPLSAMALGVFFWLRDEPLKPQAQVWLSKVQERTVPSRAYLFLVGLDAAPRTSPLALGASRLQAYQSWLASPETAPPVFASSAEPRLSLPEGAAFCPIESARCFDSLLQGQAQLPVLLAEQAALLGRYRYFLSLQDYRSSAEAGPAEPRLPLQYLTRGQQLLSLHALQLALAGDGQGALALLQEDQLGIRQHLVRADQIGLKMNLALLLNRNLEWLVHLHRAGLLPARMTLQPLSPLERSLRQPLQHEFASNAAALRNLREQDIPILLEEASLFFEYKPQTTINARFEQYRFAILLSEMAPAQFQARLARRPESYTGLRNRIGNSLLDMTGNDFVEWAGQVQDLDGKIRLAALSLRLAPGLVDGAQVGQLALAAGADNPYVARQPPYLDEQQRLCFHGPLPANEGGRCVRL